MNRKQRRAGAKLPTAAGTGEALFAAAVDHQKAGRLAEAEALYRRILAADGGHAGSLHRLGLIAYESGRYDEAIGLIGQAIARNGQVSAYHSNLGAAYQATGRTAEAIASYERALALNPDSAEAYHNLGLALWEQGRSAAAGTHFERALALKPDYAEARRNLVRLRQEEGESAGVELSRLVYGYWTTQAVAAAAKLGIADLVEAGPRSAAELARATQAHALSLRRLLLFLASLGVFAEDPDGRFRQTATSRMLWSDHPYSMRDRAASAAHPENWKVWGDFHQTIVSGEPAFERAYGVPFFEHLAKASDKQAVFSEQMNAASKMMFSSILAAYDFSRFERVVDVGGGGGGLLQLLLEANPKLRGVLADRPSAIAGASALKSAPFAGRCALIETDFFVSVPEGGDLYVLKKVLHDWTDADALAILKNCRRVIRPGGTLLLIETVLKPSNRFDTGRWADLDMLVLLRGRERSEAEFTQLLHEAGFSSVRVIPVDEHISLVEACPGREAFRAR